MKTNEFKAALCIGINNYHRAPLSACISDAEAMATLLNRHHDETLNFDTRLVVNLSGEKLRQEIEQWLDKPADHALLYFSGHGHVDEAGGYLVANDYTAENIGASMNWLNEKLNASKIKEITILLDCCKAGNMGNVAGQKLRLSILRDNVTILAASRGEGLAIEGLKHSVFTSLLLDGLNGAAADWQGYISAAGLYDLADTYLSPWQQRPVYKSSVTHMSMLRKVKAALPLEMQQALISFQFFREADTCLQLSPALLPKDLHQQPEINRFLAHLFAFHRAGLIECEDGLNPYEAALQYKVCKLTSYGQFFHRLQRKQLA